MSSKKTRCNPQGRQSAFYQMHQLSLTACVTSIWPDSSMACQSDGCFGTKPQRTGDQSGEAQRNNLEVYFMACPFNVQYTDRTEAVPVNPDPFCIFGGFSSAVRGVNRQNAREPGPSRLLDPALRIYPPNCQEREERRLRNKRGCEVSKLPAGCLPMLPTVGK